MQLRSDEEILGILRLPSTTSAATAAPAQPTCQLQELTCENRQAVRHDGLQSGPLTAAPRVQRETPASAAQAEQQAGFQAPRRAFCPPRVQNTAAMTFTSSAAKRLKADNDLPVPRRLPRSMQARPQQEPSQDTASRWRSPVLRPNCSTAAQKENTAQGVEKASTSSCTLELRFSAEQSAAERQVRVPDGFAGGATEYARVWKAAVQEELNLRLSELARRFSTLYAQHHTSSTCSAQAGGLSSSRAGAASGGQSQAMAPQRLQQVMRRAGVPYYAECELSMWQKRPAPGQDSSTEGPSMSLTLQTGQERSCEYSKNALWVISSAAELAAPQHRGPGDRLNRPWVAVARSTWHGPNSDGRFDIQLLCRPPPNLRRKQQVFALRGPDAATELSMLAALQALTPRSLPLLPALLSPPRAPASAGSQQLPLARACTAAEAAVGPADVQAATAEVVQRFSLNAEQATVLQAMQPWFLPGTQPDPLCTIHGPFGTGKSLLLVAAIHLLLALRGKEGPLKGTRVAVAAHTNAALDRVLLALHASGHTDLVRVGPVRRMDRALLPFSLHSTARGRSEAAAELEDMLRGATSPAEAAIIRTELAQVKSGAERRRRKALKTAAVVGVTCCSAGLPVLDGMQFDVVVLDEASQMVEPLSLLPLLRCACRFALLSGDPQQLPPLIAHPAHVSGGAPGLLRPLFVRLATLGHPVHMLRRQYRCHPDIAAVANMQFYGGCLLNGCTAADRPPLLPGLPPVLCIDARGQQDFAGSSHSSSNRAEARAVVKVVLGFLKRCGHGAASPTAGRVEAAAVSPDMIGVICFHRAQVALITSMLAQPAAASSDPAGSSAGSSPADGVTVATVDSYQGLEKPIIVLSTAVTRAGAFVADPHRLNVALTRARNHLILVGHGPVLAETAPAFRALLKAGQPLGPVQS